MAGAAGMVLPWMLLLMASSATAVELVVEETGGLFSVLTLTCIAGGTSDDPLPVDQRPATFLRNGSEITADDVVSLVTMSDVQVAIIFNAEQEGEFSCKNLQSVESNRHFLAGICSPTLFFYCKAASSPSQELG